MVPTKEETLEIRGRIWLWASALEQCKRMLRLRARAQAALAPLASQEDWPYGSERHVDNKPNLSVHEPIQLHQSKRSQHTHQTFPSVGDWQDIKDASEMSLVTLFCQVFHAGNKSAGAVAKNSKQFVDTHLANVLAKIFATEEEIQLFYEFRNNCLTVRDQMIGHADGGAYDVRHHEVTTSMQSISSACDGIDFDYMNSVLTPLSHAVFEYGRDIVA